MMADQPYCTCFGAFEGPRCDKPVVQCHDGYCLNGGRFSLTNIILATFLWDIGKESRPISDAAKCGV